MAANRRQIIGAGIGFGLAGLAPASSFAAQSTQGAADLPPLPGNVAPIGRAERLARIAKAQGLMRKAGIAALLVEPGSSLIYFSGVRWSRSERLTAALIPADGEPIIVTPHFEEPSVRESLGIPASVRVWNEHEDPTALVAAIVREKRLKGPVAVEETVRHFIVDGMQKAGLEIVSGAAIVRSCRMVKSAAELALMQRAADVTMGAYRYTHGRIRAGMNPDDIGALMREATQRLGGTNSWNLILLGEAAAYPHGTGKPQQVRDGEVVLMDCGCQVEGYQSDISRTFVFGEPTAEQRRVWAQMKRGQDIAFEACRIGATCSSVDDKVRAYYESLGYGPDYKLPGLSHRAGHGIGMDGHEPVNLVRGEMTRLAPGMCFSNEPGIYLPGKFGIRLEDCFVMTERGPKSFSPLSPSIDRPFG